MNHLPQGGPYRILVLVAIFISAVLGFRAVQILARWDTPSRVKIAAEVPAVGSPAPSKYSIGARLDSHGCDSDEWLLAITPVNDEKSAPASVLVLWDDGNQEDVPLAGYNYGTANYITHSNLKAGISSASASIYTGWTGEFSLRYGPCPEAEATGTAAAAATATRLTAVQSAVPASPTQPVALGSTAIASASAPATSVAVQATATRETVTPDEGNAATQPQAGTSTTEPAREGAKGYSARMDGAACDTFEWKLTIGGLTQAPGSVHLTWENGKVADVALNAFTEGTAYYISTDNLDARLVRATADLPSDWSGQFELVHGPCVGGPYVKSPEETGSGDVSKSTPPVRAPGGQDDTAPEGAPALTAQPNTREVVADVTGAVCNTVEWKFLLDGVDKAPESIRAIWDDGTTDEVKLDVFARGRAYYITTQNLNSGLRWAVAVVPADWKGSLTLLHGPCTTGRPHAANLTPYPTAVQDRSTGISPADAAATAGTPGMNTSPSAPDRPAARSVPTGTLAVASTSTVAGAGPPEPTTTVPPEPTTADRASTGMEAPSVASTPGAPRDAAETPSGSNPEATAAAPSNSREAPTEDPPATYVPAPTYTPQPTYTPEPGATATMVSGSRDMRYAPSPADPLDVPDVTRRDTPSSDPLDVPDGSTVPEAPANRGGSSAIETTATVLPAGVSVAASTATASATPTTTSTATPMATGTGTPAQPTHTSGSGSTATVVPTERVVVTAIATSMAVPPVAPSQPSAAPATGTVAVTTSAPAEPTAAVAASTQSRTVVAPPATVTINSPASPAITATTRASVAIPGRPTAPATIAPLPTRTPFSEVLPEVGSPPATPDVLPETGLLTGLITAAGALLIGAGLLSMGIGFRKRRSKRNA